MSEDKLNTKKWLYSFKVPRKYIKTVKEESKDEEGNNITISKEQEVIEDVEIFLKRPTRKMFDDTQYNLQNKVFSLNYCK